MNKIHLKIIEYLIKSYYYVGGYSYKYLLENFEILDFSKKFDLEKIKEKELKKYSKNTPEIIKKYEIFFYDLKKGTRIYELIFNYLKSLNEEDIYRLLLILLSDPNFRRMAEDNWKHNNIEPVKEWYKGLLQYLKLFGIDYNFEENTLTVSNKNSDIKLTLEDSNLINFNFKDIFYDKLQREINICYRMGAYTATFILLRKLIENLVIDILRRKFPQNKEDNIKIYYRIEDKRFHDLAILLKKLEERKEKFNVDEKMIDEFISLVKPFKNRANSTAHSIIIFGEKEELKEFKIERIIGLLIKLLENISE